MVYEALSASGLPVVWEDRDVKRGDAVFELATGSVQGPVTWVSKRGFVTVAGGNRFAKSAVGVFVRYVRT